MTKLETETVELLNVLNATGYDWLASEIIDVINQGHVELAPDDQLQAARGRVAVKDDSALELIADFADATPLLGLEQVKAARSVVEARFSRANEMLLASVQHLATITGGKHSPEIHFLEGDERRRVTIEETERLSSLADELHDALASWTASADDK